MKYLIALALLVSSITASAQGGAIVAISVSDAFVTTGSCVLVLKGADMSAADDNDLYLHNAAIAQFETEAKHYAQLLIEHGGGWETLTYETMLDTLIEKWATLPQESVQQMGEACIQSYTMYLNSIHDGGPGFNYPQPLEAVPDSNHGEQAI